MPHLAKPNAQFRQSFLAAIKEFESEGMGVPDVPEDFDLYIEMVERKASGIGLPQGIVPNSVFWLVEDDEYLGTLSIRHYLNEGLTKFGGNIGYAIRPSQRRKGHGALILKLALPIARDLGLDRALVTCDETNVASKKIIEANGGILENKVVVENRNVPALRYWIDL